MSAIKKFVHFIAPKTGSNVPFETYYGSIVSRNVDGVPNATEARRDYEAFQRSIERAFISLHHY